MTTVDRSIPFIDTHHHIWELDRFPYRWLRDPGTDAHNALIGDYKMLRQDWGPSRLFREFYGQNVIKSVHIEGDSNAPDPVDETIWLNAVAGEYGKPNAIVVYVDLETDQARVDLDRHLEASDRVRGVRIRSQPEDIEAVIFRRNYAALGALGLSYELNTAPGLLLSGRDLAAAEPGVQMIVGHTGLPLQRDPDYFKLWQREVRALAEIPNIAIKVSALGAADHRWTVDSIRPWVLATIEAFGSDRVMFGTDWPVDLLWSPYVEQVDAYRKIIADAGLSQIDQERLLYRNAERLYRI